MNQRALEIAHLAPAHQWLPTACRLGACLLVGIPSISQTCLCWLLGVPPLLPSGAALASDHDVLGASAQQGCVELKARKFVEKEV